MEVSKMLAATLPKEKFLANHPEVWTHTGKLLFRWMKSIC